MVILHVEYALCLLSSKTNFLSKFCIDYYRATHGTRQMTREEIRECYGENSIWSEINSLKENPVQQCNYVMLYLLI